MYISFLLNNCPRIKTNISNITILKIRLKVIIALLLNHILTLRKLSDKECDICRYCCDDKCVLGINLNVTKTNDVYLSDSKEKISIYLFSK